MTFDKLIILDLDETLIHAAEKPLEQVQDFVVGPYFVYLRPHARSFIDFCFASFSAVAVWTSSSKDYAEEISLNLFGSKKEDLAFLWSQERCVRKFDYKRYASYWIKDLKKVKRHGYTLEKIIAIDDSPEKLYRQYGNLVRVLPFEGLVSDNELLHLQQYLTVLAEADNVRQIEKRGWQSKINATKIEQNYQYVKERFETLIANVPGAIYRCANDADWTMEFLSDEITTISGYRAADFIHNQSRSIRSIIYPEDRDRVVREVREAIAIRQPYTIEYRIIRSDGSNAWIKDKGQGVFDGDGKLLWLDGIILDITERKWTEGLQQIQNRTLKMIARGETLKDTLSELIEQVDRLSPGLNSTITIVQEDGQHLRSFVSSQLPQDYLSAIDYLPIEAKVGSCGTAAYSGQRVIVSNIATDPSWTGYKHLILPHGFQACCSEPIKSDTGKVLGTLNLYFTEPRSPLPKELEIMEACANLASIAITRQQFEATLQHSESQLPLITDALPALISYVDCHQYYQFVNKTYEDWHKKPRTEIIGSHLREILGEANYQQIKQYVELALSGQTVSYENEIRSSDCFSRWVNVTYIPDFNREGFVKGFFGLISDISDRKATEQMKDEFVSVVSHELRTPLTSIYGALKLIVTNPQSGLSQEDREMLNIAVTNTNRLVRLVNDILDLERIESGKVKMVKQPCEAADLVHEAIEVMQPMAKVENITLVAKPVSLTINVDRDHIQQTLTNLLSNAIKFSTPNSSVQVTVEDLECEVLFKVIDTGRGIPADILGSIFERFKQVDASDSRDKGGTGLGLPICYKIIEEHGGRIWADSEFGKGSTFYFTLPKSNLKSSEELPL
ncbi:multi-sensor signal transduction histidine kinase [Pleurocapsa sp. CCALA 161]|uniref:NIF family HAD-type phosphatase n=1 Tax=Pleurocapsa sp. CCALA 161 TaxID=2107688 RepID=UPI000D0540C6|nr:NIF family HAD-type phosphatase [Pleurocapsa sp. CCALA 161]PSB09321.1 multi-sensor signal transduction histidine kinase [Pleurocapsa sp. CCALA 161]